MGMQGTVDDWRKDLLKELESYADFPDIHSVIWLTARDAYVCPRCSAREGKRFRLDQIRKEIKGEFCKPEDEDGRCRCTFIVDEEYYTKEE